MPYNEMGAVLYWDADADARVRRMPSHGGLRALAPRRLREFIQSSVLSWKGMSLSPLSGRLPMQRPLCPSVRAVVGNGLSPLFLDLVVRADPIPCLKTVHVLFCVVGCAGMGCYLVLGWDVTL